MTLLIKRLFLCLIGIIAAVASWIIIELLLVFQEYFPSYLIFSIVAGIVFGGTIGGFFGTYEGIFLGNNSKILSGIITGIIIGAIGGILGFLIAQFLLFIIGDYLIYSVKRFNQIGAPIARAIGWACLGIFIGISEGVRAVSLKKMIVGIIGGGLGGIFGGLSLEYLKLLFPETLFLGRLVGLIIFGLLIGIFYGIIEKRLAFGTLKLLNGKNKGKEFLLIQRRTKIGSSKKDDIVLSNYDNIFINHALIRIKKDSVILKRLSDNIVIVNDKSIEESTLMIDDVIQIGKAKMIFRLL